MGPSSKCGENTASMAGIIHPGHDDLGYYDAKRRFKRGRMAESLNPNASHADNVNKKSVRRNFVLNEEEVEGDGDEEIAIDSDYERFLSNLALGHSDWVNVSIDSGLGDDDESGIDYPDPHDKMFLEREDNGSDYPDPDYKKFLERLRVHGDSYVLEITLTGYVSLIIKYEPEVGSSNDHQLQILDALRHLLGLVNMRDTNLQDSSKIDRMDESFQTPVNSVEHCEESLRNGTGCSHCHPIRKSPNSVKQKCSHRLRRDRVEESCRVHFNSLNNDGDAGLSNRDKNLSCVSKRDRMETQDKLRDLGLLKSGKSLMDVPKSGRAESQENLPDSWQFGSKKTLRDVSKSDRTEYNLRDIRTTKMGDFLRDIRRTETEVNLRDSGRTEMEDNLRDIRMTETENNLRDSWRTEMKESLRDSGTGKGYNLRDLRRTEKEIPLNMRINKKVAENSHNKLTLKDSRRTEMDENLMDFKGTGRKSPLNMRNNKKVAENSRTKPTQNADHVVDGRYQLFLNSSKKVVDPTLVKQEIDTGVKIMDDKNSSDSEVIVITEDPFIHGCHTPFETSKFKDAPIDLDSDIEDRRQSKGDHSQFREKLMDVLAKPFDQNEYEVLHKKIYAERAREGIRRLRGREIAYALGSYAPSYIDMHSDLKMKIHSSKKNPHKVLILLRGFFFWLENIILKGAFQPWKDPSCSDFLSQP